MNDEDLLRVEEELRSVLEGSVLEWVLDEVDDAAATGVPEERILRRRRPRGDGASRDPMRIAASYEVVSLKGLQPAQIEGHRKRNSLVISTRPMTVRERVGLLFEALRRVLIEVPDIEVATLMTLFSTPDHDERDGAGSVRFIPDRGSSRRTDREASLDGQRLETHERDRLITLFEQAAAEVRA